jgi:DNA repair protein RecO (recombination protein O)
MLTRTEGIVLRTFPFGEADLIVTWLTRDHGLLKTFAKSPRKTKSRFGSSLEPLTYAKIAYFGREDASLPRLTQSDIVMPFQGLREDFALMLKIIELVELILHFVPEKEPQGAIFGMLLKQLTRLQAAPASALHHLYGKLRFLQMAGYLPRLETCGRCGSSAAEKNGGRFHLGHGTLICTPCGGIDPDAVPLTAAALRFYASIVQWPFEQLDRVKAPDLLVTEIANLVDAHIRYILARPLRSVDFSDKVRETEKGIRKMEPGK